MILVYILQTIFELIRYSAKYVLNLAWAAWPSLQKECLLKDKNVPKLNSEDAL